MLGSSAQEQEVKGLFPVCSEILSSLRDSRRPPAWGEWEKRGKVPPPFGEEEGDPELRRLDLVVKPC